ncbi:MAG: LysR substrate-binding domain-containing protein [Rhizomicrobium sp.]
MLTDVDDLQQEFVHERGSLKGLVRVTAPWDMGRNYVAPALDRFMAAHPGVTTSLVLSDTTLDLNEAGIDIAVRYGRLPDSLLHLRRISTNRRLRSRRQAISTASGGRAIRPTCCG